MTLSQHFGPPRTDALEPDLEDLQLPGQDETDTEPAADDEPHLIRGYD